MRSNRRFLIYLYIVVVALYWAALYWYVPSLPTYVQTKTPDLALIGTILAQYGLWQAIVRLPVGIAADWVGRRKPFILVGFVLAGVGAWMMGHGQDATALFWGRAVTGLAAAAWVPLLAVFSGLFPPAEAVRASAILTLANAVGRIIATAMNGPLNNWGGYGLAFTVAVITSGVAILFVLPAAEARRPPVRPSLQTTGRLVIRRDVLLPAVLSAVVQYANYGVTFGFLPILAKQLGANSLELAAQVTLNLIASTVGNLLATAAAGRFGSRRQVIIGFVVVSLGVLGSALAPSVLWLFVAQAAIGLATGIVYPIVMGLSLRWVSDAERATAAGLHQAVYAIGMFAGPWLSGILAAAVGLRPMFGVTAGMVLVLGLAGSSLLTDKKRSGVNV